METKIKDMEELLVYYKNSKQQYVIAKVIVCYEKEKYIDLIIGKKRACYKLDTVNESVSFARLASGSPLNFPCSTWIATDEKSLKDRLSFCKFLGEI